MTELTSDPTPLTFHTHEERYEEFLRVLADRFATTSAAAGTVFTTSVPAGALWRAFLGGILAERRQHYTCRACERFVERFGGLVTIDAGGTARPLFWPDTEAQLTLVPPFFRDSVLAMLREIRGARVSGLFVTAEKEWGTHRNSSKKPPFEWYHMAFLPAYDALHTSTLHTPEAVAAKKREDYEVLCRSLADFPIDVIRQAHALLKAGSLPRPEKCLPAAAWLLELCEAREATQNAARREALMWRAVGPAPTGFCHVRSSALGRLMELIQQGLPFEAIRRGFAEVMDPLQYQRPQAPPTAGNIAAAEQLVEKLGIAPALARRFARVEEVEALWRPMPAPAAPPAPGVFAHLKPRATTTAPPIAAPPVVMTWVRFLAEVLPDAETIELSVPHGASPFVAVVTAADPSAPPILQWDRPEKRNAFSWYFYKGGSLASAWGLRPGAWVPVTAVTYKPSMWPNPDAFPHQGKGVFFLLDGAKDLHYKHGAALFPETLKSELHPVRSTMEAFSREAVVAGKDAATACGLGFSADAPSSWNVVLRVTSKKTLVTYSLDRWH